MKLQKLVVLSMALVLLAASVATAADEYVRKVDNFIFLVDTSGSMDSKYPDAGKSKIALAKSILERMNTMIPELGYQGALSTAAPAVELQGFATYQKDAYGQSIAKVPTLIGSRPTPLGVGLAALEPALKGASGRNAVIVMSDGQENQGIETMKVATELAEKYGVCFHTIGFADTEGGNQALLDQLSALKSCGVATSAAQVADDAALDAFVRAVFYDVVSAAPAPVVEAPKKPLVVRLMVNFDFDKSDVKAQYHQELANFAEYMKKYPDTNVEISGHTDSIGTAAYNQKLSERRANSVRNYLINNFNMNAGRLSAVGYGLTKPIADNTTEAGRAENRRIEAALEGIFE